MPVNEIRLVAMDADDTLVTDELVIHAAVIEAIATAREQGVRVIIATGRMFRSVLPYARLAGVDSPVIAYNGGLVRTLEGETMSHRPVPIPEAEALAVLAAEHDLCLNFYIDDELYSSVMDERTEYYEATAEVAAHVEPDLRRILTTGPTKALIVDDPPAVEAWSGRLAEHFGGRLHVARSKPRFVEITAPGVCKGVALAEVATSFGIDRAAVMAIGDSFNDLSMLEFAGVSVAVENAATEVKRRVDHVVSSCEQGGVAEAITRLVLGK